MKIKKSLYIVFTFLFLTLCSTNAAFAHPGRTAADDCHYCRTNCDSWGVEWNVRHCHNGGSSTTMTAVQPISTIRPSTPKPVVATRIPTSTPTVVPTNIPTSSPTPVSTSTPEVLGQFVTPVPTISPVSTPETVNETKVADSTVKKSPLVDILLIGSGVYLYLKFRKNKKVEVSSLN